MPSVKNHPGGRSSSCLRKYRLVFAFGIIMLCVQVYLHTFFGLVSDKSKSSRLSSGEVSCLILFLKDRVIETLVSISTNVQEVDKIM